MAHWCGGLLVEGIIRELASRKGPAHNINLDIKGWRLPAVLTRYRNDRLSFHRRDSLETDPRTFVKKEVISYVVPLKKRDYRIRYTGNDSDIFERSSPPSLGFILSMIGCCALHWGSGRLSANRTLSGRDRYGFAMFGEMLVLFIGLLFVLPWCVRS